MVSAAWAGLATSPSRTTMAATTSFIQPPQVVRMTETVASQRTAVNGWISPMDHVPSAAEMLGWIETVVSRGIRRPGYPADAWTERWLAKRLTEFGLEVSLEPVKVPRWQPGVGVLRLDDGTE